MLFLRASGRPMFLAGQLEQAMAIVRAKVEHLFRVVKQQFGDAKVRYRGLAKKHRGADDVVRAEQPLDGPRTGARSTGMSAPAMRCRAVRCEEIEIVLSMQSDSVGAPMDPASRYVSLWANSTPSSRRGFSDCP